MLYAIVSDLHANLIAWNAVLADLSAMKAGKIICLGDVVGYGPDPAEVLESVYRHVDAFVMGNHDAVVAGKMDAECFNDHARQMVEWSAGRIAASGRAFLGRQPLVLEAPGFVCVHGSLDEPAAFNYILSEEEALATFRTTGKPLVFAGHSHQPGIAVLGSSGVAHLLPPQDFALEAGKRYIVNVGSVGDPRDADPRASYCLYDDASGIVSFRRVAFDYAALAARVRAAGLREDEIPLLRRDPVPKREPVRETLGFAPPTNEKAMARGVALRAELDKLGRANKRLRIVVAALIVALAAAGGAVTGLATRPVPPDFIPADPLPPVEAIVQRDAMNQILPPIPEGNGRLSPGGSIDGWRYSLSDPGKQHISLAKEAGSGLPAVTIDNPDRLPFVLEAPAWIHNGLATGMRFQTMLWAGVEPGFSGSAAIRVVANPGQQGERVLMNEDLLLTRPGTMQQTKRTMEKKNALRIEDGDRRIVFRIETVFSGTLTIYGPELRAVK